MLILQSARCLRRGWFWSSAAKVPCKMPWTGTPAGPPSSSPVLVAVIPTIAVIATISVIATIAVIVTIAVIAIIADVSYHLVAYAIKAVMHLLAQRSVPFVVTMSSLMSLFVGSSGLIASNELSLNSIAQHAMTSVTFSPASVGV